MNGLNNSTTNDDVVECPLCMEPLEVDDLNFFPCTCGYQICRFCWHRIRTDENELCPACRKAYPENPADFTPLSQEQISALKAEKRQRDQQRKQKITENRKHLANVRVVQKNLVFVVGLPPRLADAEILKKYEYFGKYGKIHKVVINPSTTYAGVQGPSASAYVTYCHNNDALRAIQSVNNITIDNRLIKTSLGTTKYCSHFMKNQQCPKADCMYLHELGDPEASFTKDEMHQGKHQEYEKRLHDALIAMTAASNNNPNGSNGSTTNSTNNSTNGPVQGKEAWPSLSVSPVNTKDQLVTNKGGKNKENLLNNKSKTKSDKKSQKTSQISKSSSNKNHQKDSSTSSINSDKSRDKAQKDNQKLQQRLMDDDDINLIDDFDKDLSDNSRKQNSSSNSNDSRSLSSSSSDSGSTLSETTSGKSSPGSFPEHPSQQKQQLQEKQTDNNTSDEQKNNFITNENYMSEKERLQQQLHQTQTNDINSLIDTSACLSKLSLFDDNNSFFSSSSFQPLLKGKLDNDRTLMNNQLNNAISSHLPDLLNGIDAYQNQSNLTNGGPLGNNSIDNPEKYLLSLNTTEDWEAAFKLVLFKNNKQLEEQHHQQHHQQQQQEDFLRLQELQKRNNLINSIGMSNLNGFNDFNVNNDFGGSADINRLTTQQQQHLFQQQQQQHLQQRQQQQPNNLHHQDLLSSNIFGTNMSKFFDFHKNQQQQQQHQFGVNGANNLLDHRDHVNVASLLDNNRLNSYIDHTNGLAGQQLQKQRLMNKYDQLGTHNLLMNVGGGSQQQSQNNTQSNRMQFSSGADDDLGFDPFIETQKALAEAMENEVIQQQQQSQLQQQQVNKNNLINSNANTGSTGGGNPERTRMPPPGFNHHMNAFGFGVPRAQSSKILPFMNMNGSNQSGTVNQNNGQQQQQQQQQNTNNIPQQQQALQQKSWAHLCFQQPPQNMPPQNFQQPQQDWTAMDPAILSFRQFPFSHQQHANQQHANDYMQHLSQQNGFGHHGVNLPNNILNPQQNSQVQVNNYSHAANWLNNPEQNLFMNNLTNNYNYDKFSIPPGMMQNNQKQKTECMN